MYCSKCGATLRQGSNFCQNCGQQVVQSPIVEKRLTDPPVLTGVKDTSTTKNSSLVGCLVLVIVVIIGFVILRGCSGTSSQSTPTGAPVREPTGSSANEVGKDVLLESTSGAIGVCPAKADYDEFTKLALANDKTGGQQMIDSGRVLVVSSGTEAKIIETGFTAYRVRILSGPHVGRDGWVVREAVK